MILNGGLNLRYANEEDFWDCHEWSMSDTLILGFYFDHTVEFVLGEDLSD